MSREPGPEEAATIKRAQDAMLEACGPPMDDEERRAFIEDMLNRPSKKCPQCYGRGIEVDALGEGEQVYGFREYTCLRCAGRGRIDR